MTRKLVLVAAAGAAVLALSACQQAPGAAAYVGDHHISTSEVQDDAAEVVAAVATVDKLPIDGAEVNRRQVNRLVTQQLLEEEAKRRGVTVSEAEVERLISQAQGSASREAFAAQLASAQLVPPSSLETFARTVALSDRLGRALVPNGTDAQRSDALVTTLGALSTELGTGVAPRFGTWDADDLTVALPPNDLSVPISTDTSVTSGSSSSS